MFRRLLRLLLRPIHRFLIRRTSVEDPWAVMPTFLISPGRLGPGSTRPFSWYFEGTSTVKVGNIEDVLQWLAGCTYARDIDLFHEPDYWQHPTTFEHLRRGDCEDHALWAWRKLIELGVKADFFVGQLKPESDRSGHHAWVVYERENVRYLLEPVAKSGLPQVRPLEEARSEYRPHYSVDPSYRVQARAGLLLYLREEELARLARSKKSPRAA